MKLKNIACLLLGITVSVAAVAQTGKKATQPKKADFKLLEAYKQKKLAGATPQAPPPTGELFYMVWTAADYPSTFYWRGKNGFMMCSIKKAHKAAKKSGYVTEDITPDQVHKGDTIEVMPVARGKIRIPDEIPQNVTNTLFYQVGGNKQWFLYHVTKMKTK